MKPVIKAIIFDCFGVLYPVVSDVYFERHIKEFNYDTNIFYGLNSRIDLGQIDSQEFFRGVEEAVGIPAHEVANEFDEIKKLDQEVIAFIKQLKRNYQIAMLSNAGDGELDCLETDNIIELFETLTVSYKLGLVKPDPRIFEKCISDLGRKPEECIFIDDGQKNVEGAKAIGMSAILYKNLEQLKNDLSAVLSTEKGARV